MENFREVAYGKMKKGLLYRGKALTNLNNEEIALLKKCHIKTIIDLRSPKEREEAKDTIIEGINNISIPLFSANNLNTKTVDVMGMPLPDMVSIYRELVDEDKKESWRNIFVLLLQNKGDGIMFHCTSGKDRTGVVTAMILSALDIDKESIYQDYLLTNENATDASFINYAKTLPEPLGEAFLKHFMANKEYLDAIFDEINNKYQSIDNFLKEYCDLSQNKLETLRSLYLE